MAERSHSRALVGDAGLERLRHEGVRDGSDEDLKPLEKGDEEGCLGQPACRHLVG